jgi:hypothetical protein
LVIDLMCVVGGEPDGCFPRFTWINETTGESFEIFDLCDTNFDSKGTFCGIGAFGGDKIESPSNGDIDRLELTMGAPWDPIVLDSQPGQWRDAGGRLVREEIAVPIAATTWGSLKACFRE